MARTRMVDILLLDLPVLLWADARDRHDDLVDALRARPPRDLDSPAGVLLGAAGRLGVEFMEQVAQAELELRLAAERRLQELDVALTVSSAARGDLALLCETYDAAEAYARKRGLITSAASAEVKKFRHWVLGQFVTQMDGAFPQPWTG